MASEKIPEMNSLAGEEAVTVPRHKASHAGRPIVSIELDPIMAADLTAMKDALIARLRKVA